MSYVELHAHSAFSFLDGASSPDELALRAAELGYRELALTDHDGIWGSMEFAQACRAHGLRPITGAELTVRGDGDSRPPPPGFRGNCPPGAFHLTLLAADATGYRNLCRLLTTAHAHTRDETEPLPPSVALADVERHAAGLVCLSGCARDGALAGRIARGDNRGAERLGRTLLGAFGPDRLRVELQLPLWRGDRVRNRRLRELAAALGVPCVASGDVHAHERGRIALQDALVAVRLGGTLESTEPERRGNGAATLLAPERMAARFREHPDAVAETGRLAERLDFDLTTDLGYSYPGAEDSSADRRLAEACRVRFGERYGGRPQRAEAERRLEQELRLIAGLKLSGFFLLHRDLLELAREVAVEVRGPDGARALLPPGRGRGSSVSSVVCYLTGLSHVDPIEAGLFLGRFLNEEITEAPDIDLDFPRDIRERLIPRVHERYGADRSALVAAFPTYRSKGAIRDFGKVLGLPPGEIERAARSASHYERAEIDANDPRRRALQKLLDDAYGLPRHPSQHPGGMVLSTRPLIDLCPVVPAAMEGRQIVHWDKDSCADAGFLKIDLLGLGMLSAVERAVTEIARTRGERIDLSRIPLDDPEVYRRIQAAETTGVFQIESRAQMQMLPRSRPESIEDLTVQVAIVRPGPIQGGAVHPYLERRKRLREDPGYEIPYEHPSLEPILADTLGAIVFQDQVIQVAMALAGFQLRRGRGAAPGDEPQALRGGDAIASRALRRRRRRARGRGRGRRTGLPADPRLLRLRLPEVARRSLRAARLPIDLAARPLRPRVPLRAAERATDGLLSARRARPRGAAARNRSAGAGRERERGAVSGGGRRSEVGGWRDRTQPPASSLQPRCPDRPRLYQGTGRARRRGGRRRA
jgi:error-prone DNA polymerase